MPQQQVILLRVAAPALVVAAHHVRGLVDLVQVAAGEARQPVGVLVLLRLSERRVATERDELVRLGIEAKLIDTPDRGDTRQIIGCAQRFTRASELQECLLPNRRVEVSIEARRP